MRRSPSHCLSGIAALCLVIPLLSIVSPESAYGSASASRTSEVISNTEVLRAVSTAETINNVPGNLQPSLTNTTDVPQALGDGAPKAIKCDKSGANKDHIPSYAFGGCAYGDPTGKKLMVIYGDSHAGMWSSPLATIAAKLGWRLELYFLPGCPLPDLPFISYQTDSPNTQCTEFHKIAPIAIKAAHPNLIVVTSESSQQVSRGVYATPSQWETGLLATFKSLTGTGAMMKFIGDIPAWEDDGPDCLAAHMSSVQFCAASPSDALSMNLGAERLAALKSGVQYIPVTQWICAAKCEPIIANIRVYFNEFHLTAAFVQYVRCALQEAMQLPT
jgi:hypothetical protein